MASEDAKYEQFKREMANLKSKTPPRASSIFGAKASTSVLEKERLAEQERFAEQERLAEEERFAAETRRAKVMRH
jgi:hypothetical protein